MRKLLSTSALIAPFLLGAALAQDVTPTPEPADPPADAQVEMETETEVEIEAETDTLPETDTMETDTIETDTTETTDTDVTQPDDAVAPAAETDMQANDETIVQEQAMSELRVDWITGTQVYSHQEENIGSIRDLIIDQDTNTITAAILSVGGFLGIGAKQIAVRFDELEIDYDAREIHLNLTREEADEAPEYTFRDRTEAPAPAAAPATDGMSAPVQPID